MPRPLCYVGYGLGNAAITPLPGSATDYIGWNTGDKRVRMVRDDMAADLLRHQPEDFRPCVPVEAGHAGMSGEEIAALAAKGAVHVEEYHPKAGADAVPMLVLDEITAAGIAQAADTKPKKTAKKGEE